jgi:hypothetical protein
MMKGEEKKVHSHHARYLRERLVSVACPCILSRLPNITETWLLPAHVQHGQDCLGKWMALAMEIVMAIRRHTCHILPPLGRSRLHKSSQKRQPHKVEVGILVFVGLAGCFDDE